ncbi:Hsp20/alpha crystallin family protein [Fictibacillus sp. WQ 8-8]|uniref:Hsp20/alpha crystallin family protein n=1 Tax=Fictibacillus sp. WQ 8-8 TaxID=2938788 RepID=UPI0021093F88|nr:Hsp20/alpha crystallin family protein [Fictibacillus sp. WQ 8-8]MCQ6268538.1 Hsp20/alpha crystallin family protein [Fictibacillus sp. WQ 8-8]
MDVDKLKQWLELAQKVQGNDFWNSIFDGSPGQQMAGQVNGQPESRTRYNHFQPNQNAPSPQEDFPKVDIYTNNREWIVVIDLPGIRKEDVSLSMAANKLTIKGVLHSPYKDATVIRAERANGHFERTIQLPELINETRTAARFFNGVLEVRIMRNLTPERNIRID